MPLAPIDLVLHILYTELPLVKVKVKVSALPESSETNIDFTIAVVDVAQVYKTVTSVDV